MSEVNGYGIERDEALELVKEHIKSRNLINHCLAAEAVLRAMAEHLGEDVDKWGLAGLLHDLDVELEPDLATHTTRTVSILAERGVDAEIVEAIKLHNLEAHPGAERSTTFQHALAAGETITGLVIAAALVRPDRQLGSVKAKSVRKRYKEKAFARGANREIIAECEQCGIPLTDFCELSLAAMQQISEQLDL